MKLGLKLQSNNRHRSRGSGVFLLDEYPGAAAAYALVNLTSSWVGLDVIEVRRSSDDAELGFTMGELTNGTAEAWVGVGNDGFVKIMYDQSGNGNDAIQTNTVLQPKIVSAGVLVTSEGDPALLYDSNDQFEILSGVHGNTTISIFGVYKTSDIQFIMLSQSTGSSTYGLVAVEGSTSTTVKGFFGSPTLYVNQSLSDITTRDDIQNALATSSTILSSIVGASTSSWIGARISGYTGYGCERYEKLSVFYPSDQSANRVAIETIINDIYSIY